MDPMLLAAQWLEFGPPPTRRTPGEEIYDLLDALDDQEVAVVCEALRAVLGEGRS